MPLNKFESDKTKLSYVRYVQDELGLLKLLIIDEISMVGADKLGKIDQILRLAKNCPEQVLGGCHIILSGDLFQLAPVKGKPLYKEPLHLDNVNTKLGYDVYRSVTCFIELTKNFRFKSKELVSLNDRIRTGTCQVGDERAFQNIHASFQSFLLSNGFQNLPKETLYVTPTKEVRDAINHQCKGKLITEANPEMYIWAKHYYSRRKRSYLNQTSLEDDLEYVNPDELKNAEIVDIETRKRLLSDKNVEYGNTTLQPLLRFAIGVRVMLTTNLDPRIGLFNGSVGTIIQIYYLQKEYIDSKTHKFAKGHVNPYCANFQKAAEMDCQLPIVLVKFDKNFYSPTSPSFLNNEDCILPIIPVTQRFSLPNGKVILRTQLPLTLAFATTVHKIQALSLDNEVFVLEKLFTKGLVYVGISRARTNEGLHIVESEKCKFTAALENQADLSEIHNEYNRLWETVRNESRRIAKIYQESCEFHSILEFDEAPIRPKIKYQLKPQKRTREKNRSTCNVLTSSATKTSKNQNPSPVKTSKDNKKSTTANSNLINNHDQPIELVGLNWRQNSCAIDSVITQILMVYTMYLNDSQRIQFNQEFSRPQEDQVNSIGPIFMNLYTWILALNENSRSFVIPEIYNQEILNIAYLNPSIIRGRFIGVTNVFETFFVDNRNFTAAIRDYKTTFAFKLKYSLQGHRNCAAPMGCLSHNLCPKTYSVVDLPMDPFHAQEYTIDDTFFLDYLIKKIENQKPCTFCQCHDRSSVEILSYSTLLAVQLDVTGMVTWQGRPMDLVFSNQIKFGFRSYCLSSISYGDGNHFITLIKHPLTEYIYLYDGMRQNNKFQRQSFQQFPQNFNGKLPGLAIYKIVDVDEASLPQVPFKLEYSAWQSQRPILRREHIE